MAAVAVIGERALVRWWSLAGALVAGADTEDQVRARWRALDGDVAVVVLTPAAADALVDEPGRDGLLTVVLPS